MLFFPDCESFHYWIMCFAVAEHRKSQMRMSPLVLGMQTRVLHSLLRQRRTAPRSLTALHHSLEGISSHYVPSGNSHTLQQDVISWKVRAGSASGMTIVSFCESGLTQDTIW
jgi:hypothetical protein